MEIMKKTTENSRRKDRKGIDEEKIYKKRIQRKKELITIL